MREMPPPNAILDSFLGNRNSSANKEGAASHEVSTQDGRAADSGPVAGPVTVSEQASTSAVAAAVCPSTPPPPPDRVPRSPSAAAPDVDAKAAAAVAAEPRGEPAATTAATPTTAATTASLGASSACSERASGPAAALSQEGPEDDALADAARAAEDAMQKVWSPGGKAASGSEETPGHQHDNPTISLTWPGSGDYVAQGAQTQTRVCANALARVCVCVRDCVRACVCCCTMSLVESTGR